MNEAKQDVRNFFNGPVITEILIVANILVFIWLTLAGGSTDVNVLVTHGALVPRLVAGGQNYASIFTSMFIHIGIEHIIFNMITLYFIGRLLERIIGHWKFLVIYIFSGLFANFISLAFSDPNTISAGASGAIFGIIGVWLMMAEQYRNNPFLSSMGRQMLVFTVLGVVSGMVGTNINIYAHLGGLLGGFLLAYVLGFPKLGKIPVWKRLGSAFLIIFMIIAFFKLAFTV